METNTDYLVLVNKEHEVPENWLDSITLCSATKSTGEEIFVEEKTLEQYYKLRRALVSENGIHILLTGAYRSMEYQVKLSNRLEKKHGPQYVKDYVATPGYSEHHTGLAIDICLLIGDRIVNQRDELFKNKEIFDKIHQRLSGFGFILRYPEGKEDVTGYQYEPWHIRFVGEVAKEIYLQGLTLEEYLEKVSK